MNFESVSVKSETQQNLKKLLDVAQPNASLML